MESVGDDLPGGRRNESEAAEWSGVEVFSAEVMAGTVTAESDRSELPGAKCVCAPVTVPTVRAETSP